MGADACGAASSMLQMVGNQCICVPVTKLVFRLQECDQFHMFEFAGRVKNGEPMSHRVTIGLLDGRKIRGWSLGFWVVCDL